MNKETKLIELLPPPIYQQTKLTWVLTHSSSDKLRSPQLSSAVSNLISGMRRSDCTLEENSAEVLKMLKGEMNFKKTKAMY